MPLTFLPQGPQNDSPGRIGDMILGASNRARAEERQAALLADQRKREDALLKDERAYQKEQTADRRKAALEDDLKLTRQRTQEAILNVLEQEGLLKGNDRNDPAKVQRAVDISSKNGKLKEFQDLLQWDLDPADVDKPDKVAAAMKRRADTASASRTGAQAQTQRTAKNLTDAIEDMARIKRDLKNLDLSGTVTKDEVRNEAQRRILAANPKLKAATGADIEAISEKVAADLKGLRASEAFAKQTQLLKELDFAQDAVNNFSRQQEQLGGRGYFATPEPPPIPDITGGGASIIGMGGLSVPPRSVASLQDQFGAKKTGAAPGGDALNVPTLPGDDPLIAAENERRRTEASQKLAAPAQQRLTQIQTDIERLRRGQPPQFSRLPNSAPANPYYPSQPASITGPDAAALLSQLLEEQTKVQAELEAAQSVLKQSAPPPPAAKIVMPPPAVGPQVSAPPGRPITPSANIFSTSAPQKWWA